jgi:hypothetical protein
MGDKQPIPWRGHRLNAKTILMLQAAERRLGERLDITQGSFNTTVAASANTHSQGGVMDLGVRSSGPSTAKTVRVLRSVGFAAWHRRPEQFPSQQVPEHVHAVSIFDHDLPAAAAAQRADYLAEPPRNGLASGAKDDGPRVPIPRKPELVKQTVRRRDIVFDATNESVAFLQDVTGLGPDGFFGPVTRGVMTSRFGWDGSAPMSRKLFRRLFPAAVFERVEELQPGPQPA